MSHLHWYARAHGPRAARIVHAALAGELDRNRHADGADGSDGGAARAGRDGHAGRAAGARPAAAPSRRPVTER